MPKIEPIQNSFSSGEITPLMRGRSDQGIYQNAVSYMRNMIPDSRGPALRRPGSRYLATYDGNFGRVFSFNSSVGTLYILTFLDQICNIATLGGPLPSQNFITEARFENQGNDWTAVATGAGASVVFNPNDCQLTRGSAPGSRAYIAQQWTPTTPAAQHVVIVYSAGNILYRIKIGTAADDGSILDVTTSQVNFTTTFAPNATPCWITIIAEDGTTPDNSTVNVAFVAVTDQTAVTSFVTPYLEADLVDLHTVQTPKANAVYVTHPKYPVYKLEYDDTTVTFSFTAVTFTAPPSEWTTGNYPTTGVFFQGRLWLGGTPQQPQTFWASKSGLPENFTQGPNADDGLEFTLEKFGPIRWMSATKNLVVGTGFNEFIITSESGVITPSDIQARQQSAYGSNKVQSVQIGDQVFYVSADGRKVRAMQYDFTTDNWLSRDITFIAEHITQIGIKDMAWIQNPANLLWIVLNDGSIAALIYERGYDIIGWSRHDTYGGLTDITSGELNGESFAVALVARASGKQYLEVAIPISFLDSWKDRSYPAGTTVVDQLDHLEGLTVQVLTDGAVHPPRVVSGGQITLEWQAFEIVVGLQIVSEMTTLPLDKGGERGTARHATKHWNKIHIEIYESAVPTINGTRPPTRYPATPMNTPEPIISEILQVTPLGRDREALITIRQDLPLPLNVVAIYGEVMQESI